MTATRFIAVGSTLFSFEMVGVVAFTTQGLFKSILIGLIIGAALGTILGLIVRVMVENAPWEDRVIVSPSGRTLLEGKTGFKAIILGSIFGAVGIVILDQFVQPIPGLGRSIFASMCFGGAAGGGTVSIGLRI